MENLQNLQNTLSEIAGTEIEITVRGAEAFTFSTLEVNHSAADKIAEYFKDSGLNIESIDHDNECGTFIYASL